MKTAKRTLALLLTVCLLCSTLFTSAFAAEEDDLSDATDVTTEQEKVCTCEAGEGEVHKEICALYAAPEEEEEEPEESPVEPTALEKVQAMIAALPEADDEEIDLDELEEQLEAVSEAIDALEDAELTEEELDKLAALSMLLNPVETLEVSGAFAEMTIDGDATQYNDQQTFFSALQNATNKTIHIKLLSNVEVAGTVPIAAGQTVVLDLNGFELSTTTQPNNSSRHYYAIDNYGEFTLEDSKGNGKITARGIENLGNGKMIINGGEIVSCDTNGGAAVWNEADVTINGGTFTTIHVGSANDTVGIGCLNNSGKALITGGTFNDVNARTYAIISTGEIEITPAEGKQVTVTGKHGALAVDSGTAVVNGGSYTSEDYYGLYVSNDGKGTDPMKAAVTVNGGTFDGKTVSVWVGSDYNNPVNSTIIINGGEFKDPLNAQSVTRPGAILVTGGTFANEDNVKQYMDSASVTIQTNDDGSVVIGARKADAEDTVAEIDGKYYDSLAAAVAAAKNGDKVTLLKSTEEEDITVASGKNITLDLNGNTLTVKAEGCVSVAGELTIQDSGNDGKITSSDVPMKVTGKVTVNSGIIESTNNYGIYARDGGTVEVNNGTIQSKFAAISGNNTTGNMNFIVNGGTLTAEQGPAIYMPGQTELTITGGTINGGVSLRMGQVNISGGTINAATKDLDDPKEYYNYSGNAWLPDALYVFGGTYKSDDENGNSLNLNITGGTFNCTNEKGSAVAIYDLGKEKQEANIEITGDAVLITNSKEREAYQVLSLKDIGVTEPASGYGAEGNVDQVATAISGGHYSHSVDEKYLDKDKVNAELEKKTGDAPFSYYASVEDALKDAESGDKVKDLTAGDEGETPEPVTYYEVTIVYNVDGKANTTELVAENTKFDQPSVSKSGYKLVGFMDSGEYVTFPITIDRDYHLDAIWKKKSSSGGSSSSSSSKTELDLDTGKNGDVSVSPKKPGKGDKVTITVEPDDGYVLDSIKVTDDDKIKLTEKGDNKFTFTMPSGEVTIKTTFTKAGGEDAPQFSFIDVSTGDWFAPAVDYVSAKGIMNGSNGYFSPYDNLTRGMIAQIFYNLEGGTGSFAIAYPDVSPSDWYANAVSWASANGIMSGYGSGLFGANDSVTREQLALTLYNYAKAKGYNTTASAELTAFADGASTSEWAKPAMQWAVTNGLFSGKSGNLLDPQGTATRAEVASILTRFCETIAK